MKTNKNILTALALSGIMIIASLSMTATAQVSDTSATQTAISYPIAALGSCTDKADCKDFCSKSENMLACITFAEQKGMLSGEDLRISKIVAEKISKKETPGGCTTKGECASYCEGNVEHINECISFGEELGVIPQADLAEAKKIASALKSGAKMPGSCKTKSDCQNYCTDTSHIDECLNFAEASGIIPAEDLAQARKVAPFLKNGETPGKCKTKAECDAFCENDANFSECVGFAEKAGFISAEDATMAKKVGGKGPGGCKGKEQCMAYCNEETHASECATFAQEKGLLTAEQQEMINSGIDKMKSGLDQVPEEVRGQVISCLEGKFGKEKFARIMAKQDILTQAMGDQIQGCFSNIAELMKAKYMDRATQGSSAPSGAGGPPSKEDLMKNIPDSVPPEMREQIEKNIESQMQKMPTGSDPRSGTNMNLPTNTPKAPPEGGIPTGGSNIDCSAFVSAPSCDYVPAGAPRDMCNKCKGG